MGWVASHIIKQAHNWICLSRTHCNLWPFVNSDNMIVTDIVTFLWYLILVVRNRTAWSKKAEAVNSSYCSCYCTSSPSHQWYNLSHHAPRLLLKNVLLPLLEQCLIILLLSIHIIYKIYIYLHFFQHLAGRMLKSNRDQDTLWWEVFYILLHTYIINHK